MPVKHTVLVTEEEKTTSEVFAALSSNGRLSRDDVLRDLQGLVSRLERGPAPAAIIDVDALPNRAVSHLEAIVKRFPDTRFILLAAELQPAVLLEAMHIGARHFMLKKAIAADLAAVLHRLCPPGAADHEGDVITILSAGGGCGATTVAVNLANEIQLHTSTPALIVDLDCAYATVPSYLGLQGEFGLMDLLGRSGPLDSELIASTTLAFSPTLHVLPTTSTARLPIGPVASTPALAEMLDACRSRYPYTVIDAPRVSPALAGELARISAAVLIVLQLTIKDLRVARLLMQDLLDQGISSHKLVPVVSRYRRRALMIEPEEAQHALGRDGLELLTNDFPSASLAINYGQPLSQAAPRSLLRREIQTLATVLLKKYATQTARAQGSAR